MIVVDYALNQFGANSQNNNKQFASQYYFAHQRQNPDIKNKLFAIQSHSTKISSSSSKFYRKDLSFIVFCSKKLVNEQIKISSNFNDSQFLIRLACQKLFEQQFVILASMNHQLDFNQYFDQKYLGSTGRTDVAVIVALKPDDDASVVANEMLRLRMICDVEVISRTCLKVKFDCMADLLEIDFIGEFRAESTAIINSSSYQDQVMHKNQMARSYQLEFSQEACTVNRKPTISFSSNEALQQEQKQDKHHFNNFQNNLKNQINELPQQTRITRLTSFEEQVATIEELEKQFDLFEKNSAHLSTSCHESNNKIERCELDDEFLANVNGQSCCEEVIEEQVWKPVLEGLLFTSIIVGGLSALKYLVR